MNALTLTALLLTQTPAPQATPPNSTDPADQSHRILFRTVAGDLVFELLPNIAPRHCTKIIELVMAGAYHGTYFHRLEPGFVLQHAGVENRSMPLSAQQAPLVTKLKAERSSAKHIKGALSMARADGDPDSGTSSFSILLGNAPHLDGQYTIFGELIHGWEVIENMHKVPREGSKPLVELRVTEAWYVPPGQSLPQLRIANIDTAAMSQGADSGSGSRISERGIVAGSLALAVALIGAIQALLSGQLAPGRLRSIGLIGVFLAAFLFLVLTIPVSYLYPALGIGSFLGMLCLFKLLGQFESA